MSARRALKAVLVDLNGTLHVEDSAVPGAQEALKRLRSAPVTVRFVTNTTKESKRDLLERLTGLGFDIAEHEIFTSLTAARNLLEQQQVRPLLLVDDKALPDFTGIGTDNPNAVVVGLAPEHFHYEMMNRAFRCAKQERLRKCLCPLTHCSPAVSQDCRDDVGGAQQAGMRGILVRTGKYRPADENKINPAPYLTCESFPEAVEHILKQML
ncbi:haloacid dehalogenase-like hydrolase domain-containing protein 2 [Parus major]|uniref:haloacid dehalogenase-like hydrolase domain-containing protein 2 n=1 Tax=Parus major TaxID=9157 RepID=UPI001443C4A3|nr:haloacid dehalogenase-like hydrolase domain-containing protein 2 [Parus major]